MKMRIIEDISNFVFIEDSIERADIIFIPGGSHPELGEYAADIWKQGFAPLVMPSGGVSIKTGKFNGVKSKKDIYNLDYESDCSFLKDVLLKNGVEQSAIIEENKSGSTKENAELSRKIIMELNLDISKAILCCKSFHARRALMFYQFAFPQTEFYVYPVPYVEQGIEISKSNWFKTERGLRRVMGEIQRYSNQFDDSFERLMEHMD